MAVAALRRALGEGGKRVEIASAGVAASDGAPASRPAVAAAQRHGLDLQGHSARRVSVEALAGADLVLVMDRAELEAVRRLHPGAASRSHLITELGPGATSGAGIPDPFGGSSESYEECLRRITEHVERIAPSILREVEARAAAEAAGRDEGVA